MLHCFISHFFKLPPIQLLCFPVVPLFCARLYKMVVHWSPNTYSISCQKKLLPASPYNSLSELFQQLRQDSDIYQSKTHTSYLSSLCAKQQHILLPETKRRTLVVPTGQSTGSATVYCTGHSFYTFSCYSAVICIPIHVKPVFSIALAVCKLARPACHTCTVLSSIQAVLRTHRVG